MTLNEVLDRALMRAGLTETNADHRNQARIYANATLQDIASRATWWFMFKEGSLSTTASTRSYALAADVGNLISFRDTSNDRSLRIVNNDEPDGADPDQSETGDPALIYIIGADSSTGAPKIDIYPTPDTNSDTIKYRYYKTFPELVASNDSDNLLTAHGIPLLLQHALYLGTASGILLEYGDDTSAGLNNQEMERYVFQAREQNGRMSGNRDFRLQRRDVNARFDFVVQEGSLR